MTRADWDWGRRLGLQSTYSMWVAGSQVLRPSPVASHGAAVNWNQDPVPEIEARLTNVDVGILTTKLNTYP